MAALIWATTAQAAQAPHEPAGLEGVPVALLFDASSGQMLFARQPDLAFVPASMAKVMTVYVALDLMREGKLRPDRVFRVPAATAQAWNGKGTSLYLRAGDSLTTDDLLRGIATVSANDASVVLAEGYAGSISGWSALMNRQARALGMSRSAFYTPSGWPDGGRTYVSANDLSRLAVSLIDRFPDGYRHYFGQKTMEWRGVPLRSHDPTVGVVAGADGIKTGHTAEAGYNFLGSALRDDRRLVMVIAGASSEAQRAAASRALIDWGFTAWNSQPLYPAGRMIAEAQVQQGHLRRVPLAARHAVRIATPAGSTQPIRVTLRYRGPLIAPIEAGAEVAELELRSGIGPVGRVSLYAMQPVRKAGWLDRLANGVMEWFS